MKKIILQILPILVSAIWLFIMQSQLKIGNNELPPLGKFFSPAVGFWKNVLHPDPKSNGHLSLPVEGKVVFDERMVPHIFAGNKEDAYFIQGYVHAMFRLWQMDFSTRAAEGRISEIIGVKALEFDKNKRRKGMRESALASVENWKKYPDAFNLIQSYSDGVNAYLATLSNADLPIEYKLLNYKPEPWSPYRSSLFHKNMAEILCGKDQDIELTNAKLFFGDDFDYFFSELDSLTDPVIPKGTAWEFSEGLEKKFTDTSHIGYIDWNREPGSTGIGSNNWAINSSKSITGNPIVCNDPHLFLTLPSIWFEQQIITPEINVYGVTFPGIPGVIIGFNKTICWGVTNAGWDVLDWYKIHWQDSTRTKYLLDGNWQDVKHRIEVIKVKGGHDILDTVLITNWGPIVYTDEKNKKSGLAMHWIIQDLTDQMEFATFSDLNTATNFEEYRKAIRQFPYPAQNFVFASRDGDIAITVQGNMPVKKNQQGRFVLDGSDSRNAWNGFLKNQLNPFCLNPERGFVSSANQRSTDLSYPNYYNNGDFRDYRGTLINRMLTNKEKWSVEDMKSLQYNSYSLRAETSLPTMLLRLDTNILDEKQTLIYNELSSWNYHYDTNSTNAVYFDIWFECFYRLVWDEINKDSTRKAIALPTDQKTIELMKSKPDHFYFDYVQTPDKENAGDILNMAFDSMTIQISNEPKIKDWGEYKDASIVHLSRIPAFGKHHLRTSGSKDIINAHGKSEGPSWRMIVELSKDKMNAYGIYPGGQSGNPGSIYYSHMIEDWSKGKYYTLHYFDSIPKPTVSYSILSFNRKL